MDGFGHRNWGELHGSLFGIGFRANNFHFWLAKRFIKTQKFMTSLLNFRRNFAWIPRPWWARHWASLAPQQSVVIGQCGRRLHTSALGFALPPGAGGIAKNIAAIQVNFTLFPIILWKKFKNSGIFTGLQLHCLCWPTGLHFWLEYCSINRAHGMQFTGQLCSLQSSRVFSSHFQWGSRCSVFSRII